MAVQFISSRVAGRQGSTLCHSSDTELVSSRTVSAMVNHSSRRRADSEETKQRIRAAARQSGYLPSLLARNVEQKGDEPGGCRQLLCRKRG